MRKKAMELSLNTIVIAIIVMIVLVVVVFIFAQRSGIFAKNLEGQLCDQRGAGAHCASKSNPCTSEQYLIYAKGCTSTGQVDSTGKETGPCCVPIERAK